MAHRRNLFPSQPLAQSLQNPPTIYDDLRVAEPRMRNRGWEKAHQEQKVVYRGVDPRLALRVKTIAGNLLVPEGEVARSPGIRVARLRRRRAGLEPAPPSRTDAQDAIPIRTYLET